MKYLNMLLMCVLVLLLQALPVMAGSNGNGGQPAAFLEMPIGGRPSAMGGAFTAVAEGGTASLFNPAGLALTRKHTISLAYRAMHLDRRLGYASFNMPAKENASIGFSWFHAGTAPLAERDNQGFILSDREISYGENQIAVTFAKLIGQNFSLGGQAYYIQNNMAGLNSYTMGVTFGAIVKLDTQDSFIGSLFPSSRIGAAIQNIGANYKWTTTSYWQTRAVNQGATYDEAFPVNYRLGIAFENPEIYTLAMDVEINSASQAGLHLGGEYIYNRLMAFRAGFNKSKPTIGIGIIKRFTNSSMEIDISYLADRVGEGDDILVSFDISF